LSLADENTKNLPDCDDNIKPNKWNNCFRHVKYGNGFEYSGTWKNGNFDGKCKIVDDLGNFEQGDFIEGGFNWQWDYDSIKQLNGIWSIKQGAFNETIYFYDDWIGFKNIDKVCSRLSTEPAFIRNKNSKKYGVNTLSFIVFRTNCKDNKFVLSFDNIFIGNRGGLTLFQMKVMRPDEEVNPMINSTFPERYYPGLPVSYYDSFERGDVDFFEIEKISNQLTKKEFIKNFKKKFKQ
jgi:hypothetical protein